ncbi:MAG: hypothetical protein Q8908_14210 [Bacteroidota bacterium]|nr:hypothetical protein [Bacteroidota bacterium]
MFNKIKQLTWKVIFLRFFIYGFALIGFGLCTAWLLVKLKLTNDPGGVDINDRYFQNVTLSDSQRHALLSDSAKLEAQKNLTYYKIITLGVLHPQNAQIIMDYYRRTEDVHTVEHMLDALRIHMKDSAEYGKLVSDRAKMFTYSSNGKPNNLYWWSSIEEWPVLKAAVSKDYRVIDSVARITGVSPRMISAVLIAEQIRLFDSRREAFKKWIAPLKMLTSEMTFSWGVTGIKDFTAKNIEHNLVDRSSVFYPGKAYEHLLDFKTGNPDEERFERITDIKNHYYAYLYSALCIKQIDTQWKRAGYDLTDRPEIMATLYNVGFKYSIPKPDPQVGGSTIDVKGQKYSFGLLAYEYYYSGEMADLFPYPSMKRNIVAAYR